MVKLVLFDIDGTLIRSGGAGVKAFARAFAEEFGLSDGTQHLKFCGRTDVSLVREFFTMHQVEPTPKNFNRFFTSYLHWLGKLIQETHGSLCPGVLTFLAALEAMPQPPLIGLLTGNIQRGAEIKLRFFDLWHKFPFGGFAEDHEDRDQIAVAAHRRGCERLNRPLAGHEVLVIGDTHLDVRCARAIGAKMLAVATGTLSTHDLAPYKPDWLVEDLTQISAQDLCA